MVARINTSFLDTITLGESVIIIGGLLGLAAFLRKIWPFVRKLVSLVDALDALPGQVAKVARFDDSLTALAAQVETIHHEVTPNSGGSMKDSQRRTEAAVARIEAVQGTQGDDIGGLRSELRTTRNRLDKHLDEQRNA